MMSGRGKSDPAIVAEKLVNKAGRLAAEPVERRAEAKGNADQHAVPTNSRALRTFRNHVVDLWRRTLRRRSQKDRMTWGRISKLADDFLPKPRILHPWPSDRFGGRSLRWESSAQIGLARICAGGAQ